MERRAKSKARIRIERRAKMEENVRGMAAEYGREFIECTGIGLGGMLGIIIYMVFMGVMS